jgi:hypothetical protein
MTFEELDIVPAWEPVTTKDASILPANPGFVRWGAAEPPPTIGSKIIVTMNNCGPATVTGYFTQDGFLGLRCTLHSPPEWHRRQNKGNTDGYVFGPEFRIADKD